MADNEKETEDKTGTAPAEQKSLVKKAEGLSEWLQDTLADFQPYLQKLSEVKPVLLHRMDPEVAKKFLDNQREIAIRQIDAEQARHDRDSQALQLRQEVSLQHEREIARDDRHEVRLIWVLVLVLLVGGGLALAFSYFSLPNLANTVLALIVSITSILVNDLVRARRRGHRLPAAQRKVSAGRGPRPR